MIEKDATVPKILYEFAEVLGTAIEGRTLTVPDTAGSGYCSGFVFNQNIRMLICNYQLNEDILIKNPDVDTFKRMLFFKFQHIFPETKARGGKKPAAGTPSVLVATSRMTTEGMIAIHSNASTINIEVDADYLKQQFSSLNSSPVLQGLLENMQPLIFEQIVYPSLYKIVSELLNECTNDTFALYFRRIKAEELICKLLIELDKRDERRLYILNTQDSQNLYRVKERMLSKLDEPPLIKELAIEAGMSPTKLKRLFKQVFGSSIFNYYQQFRMQEAALLLRNEKLSVSEAGYRVGFSNLGHFTRMFHQHIGMKPKQYSLNAIADNETLT